MISSAFTSQKPTQCWKSLPVSPHRATRVVVVRICVGITGGRRTCGRCACVTQNCVRRTGYGDAALFQEHFRGRPDLLPFSGNQLSASTLPLWPTWHVTQLERVRPHLEGER